MKARIYSLALCVALFASILASSSARADQTYTFTLVNKTGYGITKMYVAPHSSKDWDKNDDLLKGQAFTNGKTLTVTYKAKTTATSFDLKADWADGDNPSEWENLKIENGATYVMLYDKKKDVASIKKL